MLKYLKFEYFIIAFWFACIIYYMFGAGSYLYYNTSPLLDVISLFLIVKYKARFTGPVDIIYKLTILATISSMIGYLGFSNPHYSYIQYLSYGISAYLACMASFSFISKTGEEGLKAFYLFFTIIYILGVYWFYRTNALIDNILIQNNGFYYALFTLPFILLYNNRTINITCILISSAVCVFSTKRSAFLAAILMISIYILFSFKGSLKSKIRNIFATSILLIGGGYYLASRYMGDHLLRVFDRLNQISEDGGSGRTDIASTIIQKDLPDLLSFPELFLGNGFSAIQNKYQYTLEAAHDDFLEILYSYGSIGLILLLVFYYRIFKLYKTCKRDYPHEAMVVLIIFVIIFMYAFMANIFYFFCYSIPLFITIGAVEGLQVYRYNRNIGKMSICD